MLEKLTKHMIEMEEKEAIALADELLRNNEDPIKILDACSQAMETVGKRFEKGEYFLPHLMMAGEMLKQISDKVKPLIKSEDTSEGLGKVLMGTVMGDIHDIGKDIVTFMLEVNGFEVRDIGIDVPSEKFVEAIKDYQPSVVGMSGLLTLAYDSMKETVEAIEAAGLRDNVKIMIGGGQMSEKIREHSGADAYGEDAMAAVNLVKKWIGVE